MNDDDYPAFEYFQTVHLSADDKRFIRQILKAMTSQTLTFDTASLAVELAYKKGFLKGITDARKKK